MSEPVGAPSQRLSPYQKRLLVFLSVATFFEGYEIIALSQILPNLRAEFGLTEGQGGALVALINVGTILAYLLVRQADRWGRRRVLSITIVGYTVFSALSGLAPHALVFGLFQLVARVFLIGEWAISMVFAAEEYPAAKRGLVIGLIQGFSSLGSITCAGLVPILLRETIWEWRTVYFVGTVPLLLLAVARRNLRETARFRDQVATRPPAPPAMTRIFKTPYRRRVLQLALIWGLTYTCTQNAVTFWKEFALAERGWTDDMVGLSVTIAAVASMPLVFYSGKLIDAIGRRTGAVIIFVTTSLAVLGAYNLHGRVGLTICLAGSIFGASAVLPVLNSYTTELFPTDLRGDAFAWSNNLLGRIGYVGAPLLIGVAAGAGGLGWGPTVTLTAVFPVVALVLILRWLPETRLLELEQTASVPAVPTSRAAPAAPTATADNLEQGDS